MVQLETSIPLTRAQDPKHKTAWASVQPAGPAFLRAIAANLTMLAKDQLA